mmetsp:Transcript_31432/g.27791  ORF Transcript_31432/g.27791 Transcript_31432/m.27791 type:complete len:145 (+) Transcript_31432:342-776(+)
MDEISTKIERMWNYVDQYYLNDVKEEAQYQINLLKEEFTNIKFDPNTTKDNELVELKFIYEEAKSFLLYLKVNETWSEYLDHRETSIVMDLINKDNEYKKQQLEESKHENKVTNQIPKISYEQLQALYDSTIGGKTIFGPQSGI